MSDTESPETVLMTAPVDKPVADEFRRIAKNHGTPIRLLGAMLYEQFVADFAKGLVKVQPTTLSKPSDR